MLVVSIDNSCSSCSYNKKEAYLIMQLFEEVDFLLQRVHLPLEVQSSEGSIVHILCHDTDS